MQKDNPLKTSIKGFPKKKAPGKDTREQNSNLSKDDDDHDKIRL